MYEYPTNLTDNEWQVIKNIVEQQERSRKYAIRTILDAIMYLLTTGCQWRATPSDFAPWNTVYYYFSKWRDEGILEEAVNVLRADTRKALGKEECPSMGIIDSRSVKTSHHVDENRGIDGGKKIKGRKQHIVVDTQGLPMAIHITKANVYDGNAAFQTIKKLAFGFPRPTKILADGGYRGGLAEWAKKTYGWKVEIVLRSDDRPSMFEVIPMRWIVERTFAWIENYRRLTIDYKRTIDSSEAMLQLAFIRTMLKKLRNKFKQLLKLAISICVEMCVIWRFYGYSSSYS